MKESSEKNKSVIQYSLWAISIGMLLLGLASVGYFLSKENIQPPKKRIIDRTDFFLGVYAPPSLTTKDFLRFHLRGQKVGGGDFISPLAQGPMAHQKVRDRKGKKGEYVSPLYLGPMIFRQLLVAHANRDPNLLAAALDELDVLLEEFDAKGYWPRPAHPPLEAGWWSGMDFATVALVLQAGYEITGEERLRKKREEVVDNLLRQTQDHGSVLPINNGSSPPNACWLLEYVWDGVNQENAFFVLNGSLYTLQALKLLADATGNEEYQKFFEKGVNGFKHLEDQFYYPNGRWSYYQLRPKTIVEPHYLIIEMQFLESLFELTRKEIFFKALNRRREFFKESYPLFATDFKRASAATDRTEYLFPRIGSPHPYYIDLYRNRISFFDEEGHLVGFNESEVRGTVSGGSAFLSGAIPPSASRYEVRTEPGGTILLYQDKISRLTEAEFSALPTPLGYVLGAAYDAELNEDSSLLIKPFKMNVPDVPEHYTNNRGSIIIKPNNTIDSESTPLIGIRLFSDLDCSFRLVLLDEKGNAVYRYFPPIKGGKENLILFSVLGFNEVEKLTGNINSIQVDIFTDNFRDNGVEEFGMKMGEVSSSDKILPFYNLLKSDKDIYFVERDVK